MTIEHTAMVLFGGVLRLAELFPAGMSMRLPMGSLNGVSHLAIAAVVNVVGILALLVFASAILPVLAFLFILILILMLMLMLIFIFILMLIFDLALFPELGDGPVEEDG